MSAPWWDSDSKERSVVEYRTHVGNLSLSTDECSLKDAFADHRPLSTEIVTDRETGRSRGFGFVNFENARSMNSAIQDMHGQELDGRTINVSEANQR